MFTKIPSVLYSGLETSLVDVEVNIASRGLPGFEIVGLPSKAISESRERVKAAIVNSGLEFPVNKIMVNLAPADVPKEGSFYDLPIALGILSSLADFPIPEKSLFYGELSFDGALRHTKGAFLLALFAREFGFKNIFLPRDSANEAAIFSSINVYPVGRLSQLLAHLLGRQKIKKTGTIKEPPVDFEQAEFDMREVLGQEQAKRAIEIAAAGGHNAIMMGSPGSGKTMLARALPGILPLLSDQESLEVTKIYSVSGQIPPGASIIRKRFFRAPHHSASLAGLIGGGTNPQPGEISLAHRGVLFLDEFNEFPRSVLESLRQPLEDGVVTISRVKARVKYPARFILVASANPCPCGYLDHPKKECNCSPREISRYTKKISGPILDRIDLHIRVPSVNVKDLAQDQRAAKFLESSAIIRERVSQARLIQQKRFKDSLIQSNAEMSNKEIKKYCELSKQAEAILNQAAMAFQVSARAYFKIIKIARTIADLAGRESIRPSDIAEALQYRQ
ncbi:MAG: YifB family Mg chelatase-like AAA ATPase [Patescibacteria group bacterium]